MGDGRVHSEGRFVADVQLGGWLHSVACRVAVRANVDAARLRSRESRGMPMDAMAGRQVATGDGWASELHEASERLPEAMRRAVVLCELEGMTQVEAARELGCGKATLRIRLAGAHERLKKRLGRSGLAGAVALDATALVKSDRVPAEWIEGAAHVTTATGRPVTSAAGRLAAAVLGTMTRARLMKLAALLFATAGLAMAWAGAQAQPAANGKAAEPAPDAARVRWVHLKTDTGEETWANLDDGRTFTKAGNTVSLLDIIKHDLYTYEGRGSIVKTRALDDAYITGRDGRHIPTAVYDFDWGGDSDLGKPRRATEQDRTANDFRDYEIETIRGRRYGRIDQYGRDALGQARLEKQWWVDLQTKRLFGRRERLQVGLQYRFKKKFVTTEFDYPERGPADLFALGVPRGTPVVDKKKTDRSTKWEDQAPEVTRAIEGQAEAIRRFPQHFRAVTQDFAGHLGLEYWSASAEFVRLWSEQRTSDATSDFDKQHARGLRADHQDLSDLPLDLKIGLLGDRQSDLPVDRIAAWFPFDKSTNIRLQDGERVFILTRRFDGAGKPPRTGVHVLSGAFDSLPNLMDELWPVANSNLSEVSAVGPRPDTPPGCLVIRTERDDLRNEFTIDPAREFITVRQLEWWKDQGKWSRIDTRAVRYKQLPGGSWYVTAWEQRQRMGLAEAELVGKPADKDDGDLDTRRIEITPLEPDQFPKNIFDGNKLIEAAKKAGAVIEADAMNERPAADEPPDEPGSRVELIDKVSEADLKRVGGLKNLKSLGLLSTTVTDAGLAHLKGLTGLRTMSLKLDPRGIDQDFKPVHSGDGADISDAGLAHLKGALSGVETLYLNLGGTKVTDAGLESLKGLTCTLFLDLSGTRVTDAGLAQLSGLDGLAGLYLQNLPVTGAGLARLRGMDALETLSLANTEVTDSDLAPLKNLPGLKVLFLNNTKVTDSSVVSQVIGLTKLVDLDLSGTRVTDVGLARLVALKNLKRLTIKGVGVTAAGAATLQEARPGLRIER